MTIYLMMDGCRPVKTYEDIQLAKQQLDTYMFNLCKQGYRIVVSKDGEYAYVDQRNTNIRYTLRLAEVELVK